MTDVMFQLFYVNRRGAGVCEQLTWKQAIAKLPRLRCEARLMRDDEQVGGIGATDGGQDDQRVKWNWWYDQNAETGGKR